MNEELEHLITTCPHCGIGIKPDIICDSAYVENPNGYLHCNASLAVLQCPVCKKFFFVNYLYPVGPMLNEFRIFDYEIFPKPMQANIQFDKRISKISPNFLLVYKQACVAESDNLTEITGMAFRKAFEILVKDYTAFIHPEIDKDKILKQSLSNVINEYFKDSEFQAIFKRISWLGNDHAHTYNKHDEYNVEDLKRFINACISKIISNLDLEELNSIEPKNN